jgi:iduronate 2-sulfatase
MINTIDPAIVLYMFMLSFTYVQQALCSPSRSSLLTGRRPDTTHVYNLHTYFRNVGGNYTTIPQYFKMKGYETIGMGKIFHRGHDTGDDDPLSWTKPYFHGVDIVIP